MAQAQVIIHTGVKNADQSMRKKTLDFVLKVQEDDSLPGLDIKRPKSAADPNVRTGRVDDSLRAVMFRLTSSNNARKHYVLIGVYQHDDAYKKAERLSLKVNPINGVTELVEASMPDVANMEYVQAAEPQVKGRSDSEAQQPAAADAEPALAETETPPRAKSGQVVPEVGERHVGRTLTKLGAEEMTARLGLSAELVTEAVKQVTVNELLDLLSRGNIPEWQSDALMDLASGSSINDVALKLGIREETDEERAGLGLETDPAEPSDAEPEQQADAEASADASADAIIKGLDTDAARLSFAFVEGEDELRAAIEGGDFAAWRVFLHPEQRKWAQRDYNGSFRLSGGAGTGKTVVLVHRAVRLQREALSKHLPSPRIILTTFTKNLADELKTQIKTLAPTAVLADRPGDAGIYVAGIDSLASHVVDGASQEELRAATTAVLGRARANIRSRTANAAWNNAIMNTGVTLPDRGDGSAFVRSEYELVVLPNLITDKAEYLRVRRPNRGVRLSRGQRADVWEVVEAYRSTANIEDSVDFEETRHIAAEILRGRSAAIDQPGTSDSERSASYMADHVLVDEGQDLSVGHLRLLRSMVRTGRNDIFIAEDSHQRIYGHGLVLSHFGIRIQGRARRLTLNYRTTEQILRFALAVLDGVPLDGEDNSYPDMEGQVESRLGYYSLRTGPNPQLCPHERESEEFDTITAIMRTWLEQCEGDSQLKPEQLAVLTRSSHRRDAVVRGLAERGVDVRAVTSGRAARGKPVVLTMHRAKGTEFRNVVLAGISDRGIPAALRAERFSDEASRDVDQRERSLLYVAATRARDELAITWTGEASPFMPSSTKA
ncbi:UvrD-helicase domain-containing protein [Brevibacterium luteolum]|uniref:UvrD-helicase domain-containing protein n=1 Tax=Brevibacterium luteolum TaxID=199591 RepID=UPI0038794052